MLQVDFFSVERQRKLPFNAAALLPDGIYGRKDLGYLIADKRPVVARQAMCRRPMTEWRWIPTDASAKQSRLAGIVRTQCQRS